MDQRFQRKRDELEELLRTEAWLLAAIAALNGQPAPLPSPVDPRLGVVLLPRVGRNPHGGKKPHILERDLKDVRRRRATAEQELSRLQS